MRHARSMLIFLVLVALAACGSPTATGRALDIATPTPTPATSAPSSLAPSQGSAGSTPITPTVTRPPVASTSANAASGSRQCSYRMTGSLRNQDLTTALQAALVAAGFPKATAEVNDAGENYACNDNTSGFGLMNRDLDITLPVADLADRQALGTQLAQILTVASQYATAPSSNRCLVTFTASGNQLELIATKAAWEQARQKGLTGAALLGALQHPQ